MASLKRRQFIFSVIAGGLFLLLLFSLIEFRYRRIGMVPGQLYPAFQRTDSLVSNQLLESDERGMNYHNAAYQWPDTMRHINRQGFLSVVDYTQQIMDSLHGRGEKVIFIIGDSYVEGVTTSTFNKTFTERLKPMQQNRAVFNFGVGGMDPLQYELVAEKYLSLRPDLLVVIFCGANDIMNYDRQPTPFIPLYYQTNAGWLSSVIPPAAPGEPNRIFTSALPAYEYYDGPTTTLFNRKGLLARLCKRFCATTQFYFMLYPGFPEGNYKAGFDCGASYKYLHQIDSLCKVEKIPFEIAVTPDPDTKLLRNLKTREDNIKQYDSVFRDMMPVTHFITGFNFKTDFKATDKRHFSDEGNKKFAVFVNGVINEIMLKHLQ